MLLETLVYDQRIFGLDPQLLFQMCFQMLAVFILFLLGSYLLLDPVRKILSNRKERVMKDVREAEESRLEAERLREEYDKKIKEIHETAEEILDESRKKALAREEQIILEARQEADPIVENAHREAELEKKRVKDEVKNEIISVASLLSEKVIGASVDSEMQNRLFEQTLKEMGEETWQNS